MHAFISPFQMIEGIVLWILILALPTVFVCRRLWNLLRCETTIVFVCTKCNIKTCQSTTDLTTGKEFHDALLNAASHRYAPSAPSSGEFRISCRQKLLIKPVNCLSACDFSNCCAISSRTKYAYQFGSMAPDDCAEFLDFVDFYAASADGYSKKKTRPAALRENTICRIPPPCIT